MSLALLLFLDFSGEMFVRFCLLVLLQLPHVTLLILLSFIQVPLQRTHIKRLKINQPRQVDNMFPQKKNPLHIVAMDSALHKFLKRC